MDSLVYEGEPRWFSIMANISILLCLASFAAFVGFVIYGIIKAKRTENTEVNELLKGLDKKSLDQALPGISQPVTIGAKSAELPTQPAQPEKIKSRSPFAPYHQGKRRA